jgi:uncharacterized membrane protein YdfJ with MMPL/SSD domain
VRIDAIVDGASLAVIATECAAPTSSSRGATMLAVGSDYNLLLVSRFQEEIHAGLKTGIIRSMGGTGGVVTAAGLVFAATTGSDCSSTRSSCGPS